jgi:hypothetical protein
MGEILHVPLTQRMIVKGFENISPILLVANSVGANDYLATIYGHC